MPSTETHGSTHPSRAAVVNTLAVAGFIALVAGAFWLAIYSTRYIPSVVNGIGNAAVYVGSFFVPSPAPGLTVVPTPTASTTIPFRTATTTSATTTATSTATSTTSTGSHKPTSSSGTYTIVKGTTAPTYSGKPDLAAHIDVIGYMTTTDTSSFVGSGSVPSGARPAVKFTIKNVGTNWSGTWRFSASVPTRNAYVFTSDVQQSLAPGDSIEYVLGFDNALKGSGETITITVNSDNTVQDSNASNNTATADLTIN